MSRARIQKKEKERKGKEKKQYIYYTKNMSLVSVIKPLASSKCLDWLFIKEIVGFALWPAPVKRILIV
jgi:hypothetical protein